MSEYMSFVDAVKKHAVKGLMANDAIDNAVKECIKEGVLSDFLLKHRSEVVDMVLTEFDEETYRAGIFEEGREEGYTAAKKEMEDVIQAKDEEIARLKAELEKMSSK